MRYIENKKKEKENIYTSAKKKKNPR